MSDEIPELQRVTEQARVAAARATTATDLYCGAPYPHAHLCSCDVPLDEHDDPGWHECSDCGREWHDDDFNPSGVTS